MPEIRDKKGNIVAKLPYDKEGIEKAESIVEGSPNLEIDYAPGGEYDAMDRSITEYAGGGKVGYNKIGMYKKGGEIKKYKATVKVAAKTK